MTDNARMGDLFNQRRAAKKGGSQQQSSSNASPSFLDIQAEQERTRGPPPSRGSPPRNSFVAAVAVAAADGTIRIFQSNRDVLPRLRMRLDSFTVPIDPRNCSFTILNSKAFIPMSYKWTMKWNFV